MKKAILSKSTFIRGLQCEKSLYLYKHNYNLRDETPPKLQAIFNQGNNVGKGLDIWQKTAGWYDIIEYVQEQKLCKANETTFVKN